MTSLRTCPGEAGTGSLRAGAQFEEKPSRSSDTSPSDQGRIVKHSLTIAGHRTSISLESAFWDELKRIASARGQSLASLAASIDATRGAANLSSAIRVFVLNASRPDR
jgi:predicted DNA-binding ribbon-helix-helix protein